jgi:hypothetical protein
VKFKVAAPFEAAAGFAGSTVLPGTSSSVPGRWIVASSAIDSEGICFVKKLQDIKGVVDFKSH